MNYYEVAILKSPLQNLTYQSEEIIENGSLVEVILAKRKNSNLAVVIKKVDKPDFKCSTILSIKDEFYTDFMIEIADFVSKYYILNAIGNAINIFQYCKILFYRMYGQVIIEVTMSHNTIFIIWSKLGLVCCS